MDLFRARGILRHLLTDTLNQVLDILPLRCNDCATVHNRAIGGLLCGVEITDQTVDSVDNLLREHITTRGLGLNGLLDSALEIA